MRLNAQNSLALLLISFTVFSCHFEDNGITLPSSAPTKNVRYVANLVSSSVNSNPIITYLNPDGGTTQLAQLSLDFTVKLKTGLTANLTGSCNGTYNPSVGQSSAIVDLKIYVNDTLKAQAHDIQTDPSVNVTATAQCSYTVK